MYVDLRKYYGRSKIIFEFRKRLALKILLLFLTVYQTITLHPTPSIKIEAVVLRNVNQITAVTYIVICGLTSYSRITDKVCMEVIKVTFRTNSIENY